MNKPQTFLTLIVIGFAMLWVSCTKENIIDKDVDKSINPEKDDLEKWQSNEVVLPSLEESMRTLLSRDKTTSRSGGTILNPGFESGSTDWSYYAEGHGINGDLSQAWIFGASDPNGSNFGIYWGGMPHTESLAYAGQSGASAVQNGSTNHYLQQTITVPTQACPDQVIYLNLLMRWKNQLGNWVDELQDIIILLDDVVYYSAYDNNSPMFSANGDFNEAFFEDISLDISALSGQTVTLTVTNRALYYFQYLDLDEFSFIVKGVCDIDADGCEDNVDPHPSSIVDSSIVIDGCDSGVGNIFVSADGCSTMSDLIADAAASATNHGQFVSAVAALANAWKAAGYISGSEKGAIMSCASGASIP